MACVGGGGALPGPSGNNNPTLDSESTTNVGNFEVFTTPLRCTDMFPTEIPDRQTGAQGGQSESHTHHVGHSSKTYLIRICITPSLAH